MSYIETVQEIEQLNIFDLIENKPNLIQQIRQDFKESEIDILYEKEFTNKSATLKEIREKLNTCKGYEKYIVKLFRKLSDYFQVVEDAYAENYSKEDILISLSNDCIIVATYRCVGPVFCMKMLENRLREVNYEI